VTGDLSFFVNAESAKTPRELWRQLSSGDTAGWPMLEHCRQLDVGAAVMFTLPHPDGSSIESSGRIVEVVPDQRVNLVQETPWSGNIRIDLKPIEGGTRITVRVQLGPECLPWFSAAPSSGLEEHNRGGLKIGLLAPLSGTAGLLGRAVANAATLAVEELNASSAFGRLPAELVVADDRTDQGAALAAFNRLTMTDECDVVVACISSASLQAIRPVALARGTLFLSAAMSEHTASGKNFFQFGETPLDQLAASVPLMMNQTNSKHWFILGSDYVWPRSIGMVANEVIEQHHGVIAGEHYQPLGTAQFDEVIEQISRSGADLILSSLVGIDAVLFERAFFESGLRSRFRTLATNFDDSLLDHIGRAEADGIWSTQEYFMPTLADEMDSVARRYRERFGELAPRLSSLAKSVYDSIHLYAQALGIAKSSEPAEISAVLRSTRLGGSRLLSRDRGTVLTTELVEVTSEGFRQIRSGLQ
jgi:branched-chain amino acid transport system substrate-binding protein